VEIRFLKFLIPIYFLLKEIEMKHTTLFTTLMAIGIGLSSISANAVTNTINLGTLTNASVPIGDSFLTAAGSFIDNFNFTISPNEQFAAFVGDRDLLPNFEIGPSTFGATLTGPGLGSGLAGTPSGDTFIFSPMSLVAGNYTLQVVGTITGTTGASFGGTISAAVAAVPEPETYGMMLAGLGLVGFMSRRRKNEQD